MSHRSRYIGIGRHVHNNVRISIQEAICMYLGTSRRTYIYPLKHSELESRSSTAYTQPIFFRDFFIFFGLGSRCVVLFFKVLKFLKVEKIEYTLDGAMCTNRLLTNIIFDIDLQSY